MRRRYWTNPWEDIPLEDYENHMRLDSVQQLQAMNRAMKAQLERYPVSSAMILGIAGGNGLEHVPTGKYHTIYGVDINVQYLREAEARYPDLSGVLQYMCVDLRSEAAHLPKAGLLIANLLLEYIGYEAFRKVVRQVAPEYVSCMIQIDDDEEFVSESPYLHAFDRLEEVHQQMDAQVLTDTLHDIDYRQISTEKYPLPNGKQLVRLDYASFSGVSIEFA